MKKFFSTMKANWHSSTKEGEFLGYKEILSYSFASSGVGGIGSIVLLTSLNFSTILIGSIYKISPFIIYLMASVLTFINIVKTPIISYIMDNTSGKKGKFKPYLIWMGIPTIVLVCLIPFVPLSWVDVPAFTIFSEPLSRAGLVIFILQVLISITWPPLSLAITGLGQTITPNTLERAKVFSIQPIISGLLSSIITIAFPLLSILTIQGHDTGQESILSYRVFFPIFVLTSFLFSLLAYFNVEERIVVEKNYKPKVKFWHGVKSLGSNKYFWILTVSAIFGAIRIAGNLIYWIPVYSFESDLATSIIIFFAGIVMVPGMVLTGVMVKKFGKRNLMIGNGIVATLSYIPMIFFPNHPILLISMIYLQNISGGFAVCAAILPADALDWQQLKTGERLESFWGLFHQLILGIVWLGSGLLGPAVLELSGYNLGDNLGAEILKINHIRYAVFRNLSIVAGIASFLSTLPFFFWDLSEEKHKEIIRQLEKIAKEKNGLAKS